MTLQTNLHLPFRTEMRRIHDGRTNRFDRRVRGSLFNVPPARPVAYVAIDALGHRLQIDRVGGIRFFSLRNSAAWQPPQSAGSTYEFRLSREGSRPLAESRFIGRTSMRASRHLQTRTLAGNCPPSS